MNFAGELKNLGACSEGVTWAGERSLGEIWRDCERGDWLLWLAGELGVERKLLVLSACACARLALPHVRAGEERPRIAIETAERWCRGEAKIQEVKAAAAAARAARAAAEVRAAWAADAAARAAAWAEGAATWAAWAAGHKACADAVRKIITVEKIEEAWGKNEITALRKLRDLCMRLRS